MAKWFFPIIDNLYRNQQRRNCVQHLTPISRSVDHSVSLGQKPAVQGFQIT
ncbi:hypothetical protein [Mandarin fish ranavirus]|nr:hypothetical protein [Mandarin fish ranavirus]